VSADRGAVVGIAWTQIADLLFKDGFESIPLNSAD